MDDVLAQPSSETVEAFYRYIVAASDEHHNLSANLARAVHEFSLASFGGGQDIGENPAVGKADGGVAAFAVAVAVAAAAFGALAFVALVFIVYAGRAGKGAPAAGKACGLSMDAARESASSAEAGVSEMRDAMLEALQESLRAIQSGLREIEHDVEMLVDSVRQIAADQSNLSALQAAIETVRTHDGHDGFAVIANEMRTLAGRSSQLSDDARGMAGQLRSLVGETMARLERLAGQIESRRINANVHNARNAHNNAHDVREDKREGDGKMAMTCAPSVFSSASPEQDAAEREDKRDGGADH
ncbi:MAG: methyl-accepting chemotaxis protein [Azoarcus sp.]|nr:methyl-accepting chemotaxis protein [Azoarcus sp.]